MSHTIDYSNSDGAKKVLRALKDISFYIGREDYVKLRRELYGQLPPEDPGGAARDEIFEGWAFALSFIGINGYPTLALFHFLCRVKYGIILY